MSFPVIQLSGPAAERAQHLVAVLLAEEIDVARLPGEEENRTLGELTETAMVGLAVNATYDIVKRIVIDWIRREEIGPEDISLSNSDDAEETTDIEWDWPET